MKFPALSIWVFALLALLAVRVIGMVNALALYFGVRARRGEDVTTRGFAPPEPLKSTLEALERLGFNRLGEVQTRLPFQQLPVTEWVLTSPDQDTLAELVMAGGAPYVQFQSAYPDDAVVETGYPYGERIETADFNSGYEKASLPDAFNAHEIRQMAFSEKHGTPRKFGDLQTYMQWGAVYRAKHAERKLRDPIVRVHIIPFITELVMLIMVAAYSVLAGEIPLWMPIAVLVVAVFIESGIWRGGRP